jgi:hypothetical protein
MIASFLHGLLSEPEDGRCIFPRNVGKLLADCIESYLSLSGTSPVQKLIVAQLVKYSNSSENINVKYRVENFQPVDHV